MAGRVVMVDDTVSSLLHHFDRVEVHRADGLVPENTATSEFVHTFLIVMYLFNIIKILLLIK